MLVTDNRTVLKGVVRSVKRVAHGVDFELKVLSNLTTTPESDFIRPRKGQTLRVFSAVPELLKIGAVLEVDATLNADAHGERLVMRSARPAIA